MVVCGMGNVGPWVFDEILRGVEGIRADWQSVVLHEGQRDLIELRLELSEVGRQNEVERAVLANLRERFPDFWKNREMKLYDLRILACAPGALRNGERKLKRVIDERQMLKRRARFPAALS
jgi:phenylacetate-coenzyme A ligase PaaK-like adenylate-forming protein